MKNHPDRVPANRSLVVATLKGISSATFKQLVIATDDVYIQPLNPNWHEKVIKIDGSAVINGVAVGKWIYTPIQFNIKFRLRIL